MFGLNDEKREEDWEPFNSLFDTEMFMCDPVGGGEGRFVWPLCRGKTVIMDLAATVPRRCKSLHLELSRVWSQSRVALGARYGDQAEVGGRLGCVFLGSAQGRNP